MATNLLMVIKLDTETIAFLSLIVSIVGALAAIFAAFYAKKAATKDDLTRVEQNTQYVEHFSNKILSINTPIHPQEKPENSQAQAQQEPSQAQAEQKISPAQQEASMAQVQREASPAPIERKASQVQAQQEASQAQPQRVSISVEGEALGDVPLELLITVQDSLARVSRVERVTEAGKILGSTRCRATDDALVFKSILALEKVRQWWDAEELIGDGGIRSVLRVYLLHDKGGREVYRDVPVSIVNDLRNVGITKLVVWTIKGSI